MIEGYRIVGWSQRWCLKCGWWSCNKECCIETDAPTLQRLSGYAYSCLLFFFRNRHRYWVLCSLPSFPQMQNRLQSTSGSDFKLGTLLFSPYSHYCYVYISGVVDHLLSLSHSDSIPFTLEECRDPLVRDAAIILYCLCLMSVCAVQWHKSHRYEKAPQPTPHSQSRSQSFQFSSRTHRNLKIHGFFGTSSSTLRSSLWSFSLPFSTLWTKTPKCLRNFKCSWARY